jgi:hypothetical protein
MQINKVDTNRFFSNLQFGTFKKLHADLERNEVMKIE